MRRRDGGREAERRGIKMALVPKSIDNDLAIRATADIGVRDRASLGVQLVKNLMEDARTSGRWYLGVTMGRPTGHLTLGIGKAVSATCTVIPEEFGVGYVSLADVADIVEGSIIKRRAMGKAHGVAILSEALVERFNPKEVAELEDVDRDAQGNIRVTEVDLGRKVINEVTLRLEKRGIKVSIVDKTIGYELRCAPPLPMEAEYGVTWATPAVRNRRRGPFGSDPMQNARRVHSAGDASIRHRKRHRRAVDVPERGHRVRAGTWYASIKETLP